MQGDAVLSSSVRPIAAYTLHIASDSRKMKKKIKKIELPQSKLHIVLRPSGWE